MKKISYVIVGIIFIFALIFPFLNRERNANFDDLKKVVNKYQNSNLMEVNSKNIAKAYKLKTSEYDDVYGYLSESYMNVEEIVIFKESNDLKRSNILEKIDSHFKQQLKSFEGYGVNQTKLLNDRIVIEKGDYFICIVGENAKTVKENLLSKFK